ncbi:cytoplasmic chaperone TorD family protein [Desulfitobacterium hafniense DCB-2]|uniref:Cytoplasmic chaperone TorD family protein n=1 Tax=Desulfitobacterium hafniense (strain DSM 10664 / DCB-2) TaxID=272564 RepID=B8G152_DESHD|nr:molecular chaperone TorD family protein [Desulfitobacterium hafniense]ACL19267.1 cytoplasmic chaperone TorD family protein [Desulfitobacterium hafniense DCB-2]
MEIQELKQIFITQQELYRFLSNVITLGPKKELLDRFQGVYSELIHEEADDDNLVKGLITIQMSLRGKDLASYEAVLTREYTRLFIGPGKPPVSPYASIYISDEPKPRLMDESTIEVRKQYLDANIVMANMNSVPDDFLGAELEYINYLTIKSLEAIKNSESEELGLFLLKQEDFISNHLATWIPKFSERIFEFTSEDFFKGMALLLNGLINSHLAILEDFKYSLKVFMD